MKAVMNADEFKRIVDNTKKFTRSSMESELMSYIHLKIDAEKNEITAEALDGHRFSIECAVLTEADESFECYIKTVIPSVKKLMFVELELRDKILYVAAGDIIQGYKQPEGKFYNIDQLISDLLKNEPNEVVGVNPMLFIDALKAADQNYLGKKYTKIEIRKPSDPIILKSGDKNIKGVLPVKINY